jgi:hypothetical protein
MSSARLAVFVLAAAAIAPSPSLADTPATTQWLVTSAKATGSGGEQFVTSLRIVNPNVAVASVDLYFLPASALDGNNAALGDNSSPIHSTVTVAAGQTLAVDDLLASRFGISGAGGVRIESRLPVSVLSQTLNASARSATGVAGTYGFAIPGQTLDQAVSAGDTAYIPYISSAPDGSASGYRTNLFLQSANSTAQTVVNVRLSLSDGTTVGQADYTLGKSSQTQINRIASVFGYSAADTNLTAWVTVKSGGPVLTGASVIDNAIGSISYSPPFKVFAPNNGAFGLVFGDGGYDFSTGRLDILSGALDYLAASLVLDGCPSPSPAVQYFPLQAWFSTSQKNSTATRNADGSIGISGGGSGATWIGTVRGYVDGTLSGTLTYVRAAGVVGTTCPGVSKTFLFNGARASAFPPGS